MKQIIARVVIYSFASLIPSFIAKGRIDLYVSHSNPEDAIRLFIEKIPNGSLLLYVWGITFLVAAIPGSLYEFYLRKKETGL